MKYLAPAIGRKGAAEPIAPSDIQALSLHEQQRVAHLVLGIARPVVRVALPKVSKRGRRRAPVTKVVEAVTLSPGIEEAVALREEWSHKNAGTPETHEKHKRRAQGALTRLYASRAIDLGQLGSAEQISQIYEAIASAVEIGIANYGVRVDGGISPGDRNALVFAQVRGELAYTRWRTMASAIGPVSAFLEMIVDDVALTEVARRYRMDHRRMCRLLIEALNLWPRCLGIAGKEIFGSALVVPA